MAVLSLRLLATLGFAALHTVAVPTQTTNPYEGLTPREITRADGTTYTVWENRGTFIEKRSSINEAPLDKRLSYTTYTPPNGRNDYCGEASPTVTYPPSGAQAADCVALAQAYTESVSTGGVKAYWTVSASDFKSAPGGLVTLAALGTCRFPIRLPNGPAQTVYFGANDLRFYVNSALQGTKTGGIEAVGSVACNNNTDGAFLSVEYRITRA